MSYPSLASMITGASVRAATAPRRQKRLSWRDSRIRRWIVAGVVAGHAQAATLTCIGFFIIDVLKVPPLGAEQPIAIVMMAGAGGTLAAQWGLIPKLDLSPRALIVWGSLIAALGLGVTALAGDLYGLVLGFGLTSIGFGFTRPGFTAGASLAVPHCGAGRGGGRHHLGQRDQLYRRAGGGACCSTRWTSTCRSGSPWRWCWSSRGGAARCASSCRRRVGSACRAR